MIFYIAARIIPPYSQTIYDSLLESMKTMGVELPPFAFKLMGGKVLTPMDIAEGQDPHPAMPYGDPPINNRGVSLRNLW